MISEFCMTPKYTNTFYKYKSYINNQKRKQPGWNWSKSKQLVKQPLNLSSSC